MKCANCGGGLEGAMNFCSFCGVRQEIDLRQINFRDLGANVSMECPHCEGTALDVIEFDLEPKVTIERCRSCFGMFFNPGELEYLIEAQIHPVAWLDLEGLNEISAEFGHDHRPVYRKCPMCQERMSHINFGGRSGVILDQCGQHGLWLDGGELRRLTEWWRGGGKFLHQQHQEEKAKRLYGRVIPEKPRGGSIESPVEPAAGTWMIPDVVTGAEVIGEVILWIVQSVTD